MIGPFLIAWGAVLLTWLVLAWTLGGIGLLLLRAFRVLPTVERLVSSVWVGYCAVLLLLQLWHLVLPVNVWFWLPALAISLSGWYVMRTEIRHRFTSDCYSKSRYAWVPLMLVTVWVANRAMGPNNEIDSHLYHIPTIQWLKQYPVVPGLGNLYLPLAANSSSLLFCAWLDSGPWEGRANHVVNGFLITALFWHAMLGGRRVFDREPSQQAVGLFKMLAMIPAVQMTNHWMVSGYSTDVAPAALVLVAASELFSLWCHRIDTADRGSFVPGYSACCTAFWLAGAWCCKLTALAFGTVATLLTLAAVHRWHRKTGCPWLRSVVLGGVLVTLLTGVWATRGVVLSGYPLYPSTSPSVNVEWKIPRDLVEVEKFYQMTRNRLRHFYDWGIEDAIRSLAGWGWLRYWVQLLERDTLLPTGMFVIFGCVAFASRTRYTNISELRRGWLLLVPTLPAIVFWFLTQATQRMGFFLFWVAASTAAAIACPPILQRSQCSAVALAACIILLAAGNVKKTHVPPGSDFGFHPPMDTGRIETFVSEAGLTIYRPADGGRLCSDAPIPATPTPRKDLLLRKPGDLASGFKIEAPQSRYARIAKAMQMENSITSPRLADESNRRFE